MRILTIGFALAVGTVVACASGGSSGVSDGGTEGDETQTGTSDGDTDAAPGDDATDGGGVPVGDEEVYQLRLEEEVPPPVVLEMNRAEVAELFGDTARDILLLEVDSTDLLIGTMEQVKQACGDGWMRDDNDPEHDCSLTELGRTFVGADGTWQTSAEYALLRVLTMTPANVDVDGTTSEGLADLADNVPIIDDYSQMLSDALGIPRTQEIVSTPSLVAALKEHFVATHPAIGEDAKIPVTLADALSDLSTLTDSLGPAGDHPGIVDPEYEVFGEVLGPDFQMRVVAESNLRTVHGVGGRTGKGFASLRADTTGPTFEDELEFDFSDPERFGLRGLVEDLTVDIRFLLTESPAFVSSCVDDGCQANLPDTPVGDRSVWNVDPWLAEYAIAAAARNEYANRVYHREYLIGLATVDIGQDGDPPGWIKYSVFLNLGNPPQDQYLWETVLEVAQVASHASPFQAFPEGDVNVGFTLNDLPVGLSGAEASEAVRPYLQDQSVKLSDFVLGDYKKNNDDIDFFYLRASDGQPYLFFVTPDDLREDQSYGYTEPGFFSDAALTAKVSKVDIDGVADTSHEKLSIGDGETVVYFQGANSKVYRARFERTGGRDEEVDVALAPVL